MPEGASEALRKTHHTASRSPHSTNNVATAGAGRAGRQHARGGSELQAISTISQLAMYN